MRKALIFLLPVMLFTGMIPVFAQFEITPYAGYMLGGGRYEYSVENGPSYGIQLGVNAGEDTRVIFFYSRMDSRLTKETATGKENLTNMATDYLQIGVLRQVYHNDRIAPYGLFTMGTTIFTPKNSVYYTQWVFSIVLGGGLRVNITEHMAFQAQARMLMPMRFAGGGFWCGTGGCGGGASAYSAVVQGDFTGGIVFSF